MAALGKAFGDFTLLIVGWAISPRKHTTIYNVAMLPILYRIALRCKKCRSRRLVYVSGISTLACKANGMLNMYGVLGLT